MFGYDRITVYKGKKRTFLLYLLLIADVLWNNDVKYKLWTTKIVTDY